MAEFGLLDISKGIIAFIFEDLEYVTTLYADVLLAV